MSIKNPLTPAGIEAATFRFVAQHLNHCATAVPLYQINTDKYFRILLNHHFISNIRKPNMFHPLKVHLQGVQLIHSSSVSQQYDSPVVKFW